jgi:hypothetical protein
MAFEMEGHSTAPDVYIVSKGVLRRFTHLNAALKRAAEWFAQYLPAPRS